MKGTFIKLGRMCFKVRETSVEAEHKNVYYSNKQSLDTQNDDQEIVLEKKAAIYERL